MIRYGLTLEELPERAVDAVEIAERQRAATVILRDGAPVAALIPAEDLDRVDPPDPGVSGADPLLALCGSCAHDELADQLIRATWGPVAR